MSQGRCEGCGEVTWLLPLHGPKGGPLRCFKCAGEWNAKYGRRRKAGRVVIKAMKAFAAAGGSWSDYDKLKIAAGGFSLALAPWMADTLGAEVGDITSELLTEAIELTHPDRHPAELKEKAQRVTQELLALRPFVFPAPKPEPLAENDRRSKQTHDDLNKPSQPAYPCEDCEGASSSYYCDSCKVQWNKEQEDKRRAEDKERQEKNARQRDGYKRRRAYSTRLAKFTCATCSQPFKPKRRLDVKYCSPACRQRAYVKRDGKQSNSKPLGREEIERTITEALTSNPDSAFTADELCDRVYLGLKWPERKHRAAVTPIAKKVCERLGEHWEWWRSEKRGGTLVFLNRASVTSYAMARLKGGLYMCRSGATEEELKAEISQGGRYHEYVVKGGAWWQHCQEAIAKLKQVTAKQMPAGGDLTIRQDDASAIKAMNEDCERAKSSLASALANLKGTAR
jgi:hypothetical protein